MIEVRNDDLHPHRGASVHRKDLTGQRFGSLTVLEYVGNSESGGNTLAVWRCRCDCGRIVQVKGKNLVARKTTHCGCGALRKKIRQHMFAIRVFEALIGLGYKSLSEAARADGLFDGMTPCEARRKKDLMYNAEMGRMACRGKTFNYICGLLGIDMDDETTGGMTND